MRQHRSLLPSYCIVVDRMSSFPAYYTIPVKYAVGRTHTAIQRIVEREKVMEEEAKCRKD